MGRRRGAGPRRGLRALRSPDLLLRRTRDAGLEGREIENREPATTPSPEDRAVNSHYGRGDLAEGILSALRDAGKDPDALTPEDLAPVDQFHTRGRRATLDLADLAGVTADTRVLDVGGGIGGPARTLAGRFGCRVEVLDVTEEFCRVGRMLTAGTNLDDLVSFRPGSALDMPYPESAFDLAWTQHSSMNIQDKERLYREVGRVLRPGGRLALHEVMAGPASPARLPVPWAREPGTNHLRPPEAMRALMAETGFRELAWNDETALAAEWFRRRLPAENPEDAPRLGLHLLLGPQAAEMIRNLALNLEERRISVVQALFEKP